jgi:hypothetical protein
VIDVRDSSPVSRSDLVWSLEETLLFARLKGSLPVEQINRDVLIDIPYSKPQDFTVLRDQVARDVEIFRQQINHVYLEELIKSIDGQPIIPEVKALEQVKRSTIDLIIKYFNLDPIPGISK